MCIYLCVSLSFCTVCVGVRMSQQGKLFVFYTLAILCLFKWTRIQKSPSHLQLKQYNKGFNYDFLEIN